MMEWKWSKSGRKSAGVLLSVSMLSAIVAACGGSSVDVDKTATGQDADPVETAKPEEPATVVFYSNNGGTQEAFDLRFGHALRQKFPHYTIEYIRAEKGTMLPELVAAGRKFDIFFASIGNYESALFEYKLERDMTSLIADEKIDMTKFDASIIEAMKQISGGKMYGLPVFNNVQVLFYNKTIFDKFGVPYPKDGMTWNEAIALGKQLNKMEDGRQYVGLSVNPGKMISLNPFSIPAVDPKTGKPTLASNEQWKTLFQTMFIEPLSDPGARAEAVRQNKVPDHYSFVREHNLAMYAYSSDLPAVLPAEMGAVDWDMVSLPHYPDQPRMGAQAYPSYFGVTSFSEQPKAAMKVIQYMVSEEFQMQLSKAGVMPVLELDSVKRAFGSEADFKNKHLSSVFYNKSAPIPNKTSTDPAISTIYRKQAVEPIILKDVDVNTAIRQAEEAAIKAIEQENSK